MFVVGSTIVRLFDPFMTGEGWTSDFVMGQKFRANLDPAVGSDGCVVVEISGLVAESAVVVVDTDFSEDEELLRWSPFLPTPIRSASSATRLLCPPLPVEFHPNLGNDCKFGSD